MNLPVAFTDKMKKLLGNEYDEYIACYDETRLYGLRVNTKKISVEDFKKICPFEIEPIPWMGMFQSRHLMSFLNRILQKVTGH